MNSELEIIDTVENFTDAMNEELTDVVGEVEEVCDE